MSNLLTKTREERKLTLIQAAREIGIGYSTICTAEQKGWRDDRQAGKKINAWINERYDSAGAQIKNTGRSESKANRYMAILPNRDGEPLRVKTFSTTGEAAQFCEKHFLENGESQKIPAYRIIDVGTGKVLLGNKCTIFWGEPSQDDKKEFEIL